MFKFSNTEMFIKTTLRNRDGVHLLTVPANKFELTGQILRIDRMGR